MERSDIERKKDEMPGLNEDGGGRSTILDYKHPVQRVLVEPTIGEFLSGFTPTYLYTSFGDMKP